MSVNDTQVGGTHYKSEYQHWDFVIETDMPYVLGCATKYLTRWRKKNGVEDLKKARHYIEKAKEARVYIRHTPSLRRLTSLFVAANVPSPENAIESEVIYAIIDCEYPTALLMLDTLITTETNRPLESQR